MRKGALQRDSLQCALFLIPATGRGLRRWLSLRMLFNKHHIPIDGRQILRAAHGHGVAQLRADLFDV